MEVNIISSDELKFIKEKVESIEKRLIKNETKPTNALLTNQEFCNRLKITTRTSQKYRDEGKISFVKIGSNIHYYESDVQIFLLNHRKESF